MERANESLAPALGLPRLPVLDPPEPTIEDTYFGLHWKTRGIVEHAAGRPFAWIDDEITEADREWVSDHHSAPALMLRVDPRCGLTANDLDDLVMWVARHGVPGVQ
jgi:hypothetical protein